MRRPWLAGLCRCTLLSIVVLSLLRPHVLADTGGRVSRVGAAIGDPCCDDLPDFGTKLDFNSLGLPHGTTIADSLIAFGVVFAPATQEPAPNEPTVVVASDAARPDGCRLTASGLPLFTGDEVMQFLDHHGNPMAVSRVGASAGLLNEIGMGFMSVYDCAGNELATILNSEVGFEFLHIELEDKVIHYVVWGDFGDQGGEAVNCITFDGPEPCGPTKSRTGSWGRIKSLYSDGPGS